MDLDRSLRQKFQDGLLETVDSEYNLLASLMKMGRGLRSPNVAKTFERCATETQAQIGRLNRILDAVNPDGLCYSAYPAPKADKLSPIGGSVVLDAVLASAIQAVHRFSAGRYQHLRDRAERLGLADVVCLLDQTMNEKAAAVDRLEPLTELSAADFDREEIALADHERTVVISNDNRPEIQRQPYVDISSKHVHLRRLVLKDNGSLRG